MPTLAVSFSMLAVRSLARFSCSTGQKRLMLNLPSRPRTSTGLALGAAETLARYAWRVSRL